MNEDNNMIPVSFSDAKIGKELDNAHCLQASSLQKEGITQKQEMTRIVCPVLTPDRAEKRQNGRRFKDDGEPSYTLTAQDIHGVAIGVNIRGNEIQGAADEAHCLNANDQRKVFGAQQERTIVAMKVREATKQGYAYAHEGDSINLSMPDSKTRRGRIGGAVAQTLDTSCNQGTMEVIKGNIPSSKEDGYMVEIYPGVFVWAIWYEKYQRYIAIRKLTPRECFRLQGWTDEYFDKAQFVNTDSQLYKQAGNGVTVSVVKAIAEKMRGRK